MCRWDLTVSFLHFNTISALSVKELPEEELNEGEVKNEDEKYGMVQAFKLLIKNKYYMMICGTYILDFHTNFSW